MTKTKKKISKGPPKRFVLGKDKSLIVATAVVIAIFVLPLLVSYSNFYPPLIPKSYIYLLDSVVADIPLLPKTPKQVVTKALLRNQSLQSYSLSTNLKVATNGSNQNLTAVDLKVNTAVENAAQLESKTQTNISGSINLFDNGQIDIASVKEANNYYLNVRQFPLVPGFELGNLDKIWYKIDMNDFQKGLSVSSRNDQQIVDDVRGQFANVQEGLIKKSLFSNVSEFKKIKQSGGEFYQIKFKLDESSFTGLALLSQNSKLTNPELTLWVNTDTYYLTKLNLTGTIVPDAKTKVSDQQLLTLNLNMELSKINQGQNISIPTNPTEIKGSVDLALKVEKNTDTAALFDSAKSAKDLGENFLTVERLITVLLLLPKAI